MDSNSSRSSITSHPRGLFFLSFTAAWERFSFYGMTSVVALYMVNQILLPGHIEKIAGFSYYRASTEWLFGPLSGQALASQIYGLYASLVYFTPLLGGYIADRWIGQRNSVLIGLLLLTVGQLSTAFEQTFLIALLLLVTGSGFLKGNITTQVGELYGNSDNSLSARGFTLFGVGTNIGAVCGPLLCGILAQAYGWKVCFLATGLCMILGSMSYLCGYRDLGGLRGSESGQRTKLTRSEWQVAGTVFSVLLITVFQSVSYFQLDNVFLIWVQQHVALTEGKIQIPVPWFVSVDSLVSIVSVPLLFRVWRYQERRNVRPDDLQKIGIGATIAATSNLVLVLGIRITGGEGLSPIWPLIYCAGMGVGFLYYWPTVLALVSRTVPAKIKSSMISLVFLTAFVANNVVGWIGTYYERLGPAAFWAVHSAIAASGTILVWVFRGRLSRKLAIESLTI